MKLLIRSVFKLAGWLALAFVLTSVLLVGVFRFVDPHTSSVILQWQWQSGKTARHQWQPLARISPELQIAVIAAEDQKFPHHFGFDLESIRQALSESGDRPRGASTITQQVAKNLFLWPGRSYLRKALEAWMSLLMETLWPKQRILEMYLNIAEFGEGVYGAEAAAQFHFHRPARQLTTWQAGLLAAVLPNPRKMLAGHPSAYVKARALTIASMANQLGGTGYLETLDP